VAATWLAEPSDNARSEPRSVKSCLATGATTSRDLAPVATRQRMVSLLIVDDSDEIRRMLRTFVGSIADPIYECRDGGEACAAYAAHRPDWVLMDVSMLPMDGITATRQIVDRFPAARRGVRLRAEDRPARGAAAAEGREVAAPDPRLSPHPIFVMRLAGPGDTTAPAPRYATSASISNPGAVARSAPAVSLENPSPPLARKSLVVTR
jgi:CheY-like chemotaxis protein